MTSVNVSLPDEVLRQVDELASQLNCTRNDVLRKATIRYVTQAGETAVAGPYCNRNERIEKAIRATHELAKQLADGVEPESLTRRRSEREANK